MMKPGWWNRFALTREEQLLVAGIILIALIGSVARHARQHRLAETPAGVEQESR